MHIIFAELFFGMDWHSKLVLLLGFAFFILNAGVGLMVPMNTSDGILVNDATRSRENFGPMMENVDYQKDCGNFLDPCGSKDDPPCCAPDFCLQGYCQNNTVNS